MASFFIFLTLKVNCIKKQPFEGLFIFRDISLYLVGTFFWIPREFLGCFASGIWDWNAFLTLFSRNFSQEL